MVLIGYVVQCPRTKVLRFEQSDVFKGLKNNDDWKIKLMAEDMLNQVKWTLRDGVQ